MQKDRPQPPAGRLSLVLAADEARLLWTLGRGRPTSATFSGALKLRARGLARRTPDGALALGPPVADLARIWTSASQALHLYHWDAAGTFQHLSSYSDGTLIIAQQQHQQQRIFDTYADWPALVQHFLARSGCQQLRRSRGRPFTATHAQLRQWLGTDLEPAPQVLATTLLYQRSTQQQWLILHTPSGGWQATASDEHGLMYWVEPVGGAQLQAQLNASLAAATPLVLRQRA